MLLIIVSLMRHHTLQNVIWSNELRLAGHVEVSTYRLPWIKKAAENEVIQYSFWCEYTMEFNPYNAKMFFVRIMGT